MAASEQLALTDSQTLDEVLTCLSENISIVSYLIETPVSGLRTQDCLRGEGICI
jgi:hypothetical protein